MLTKNVKYSKELSQTLYSIVPGCVSITRDPSCKEIIHNPYAAKFLRLNEWENANTSSGLKIYRNGKKVAASEMPLPRAILNELTFLADELEFIWADGVRKVGLWNSSPIYDENGILCGAIATCEDITERKKMEEELNEHRKNLAKAVLIKTRELEESKVDDKLRLSEQRFTKIFYSSLTPMSISTLDEGQYIDVNDSLLKMSGYSRDEMIGNTVIGLNINIKPRQEIIKRLINEGRINDYEMLLRTKSGEIITCQYNAEIIELNGIKCILAMLIDLTEKIRFEKQVKASEERFLKAFNSNLATMAISTLEEGRHLEVNECFLKTFGYQLEEVIGKTVSELNVLVQPERNYIYKQLIKKGRVTNLEVLFKNKQGDIKTGQYHAELIEMNSEKCILVMIIDITEWKQLKNEITRLDKLNLIGQMSAGISHEIRNPMTTVRGFLQILAGKEINSPNSEYYDLMISELDRANHIISEFLLLAQNKAIELHNVDLNNIINRIMPLLSADALREDKNVIFKESDIPELLLDESEIRQLIFNLARNGLDAMKPKGSLTISTYTKRDEVILEVKDEGSGISPEVLDKLGTPFFTTKDTGTGLGLAICYSISHRHNAKIDVNSSSEGTSFCIRFKATKARAHYF